MGTGTEHQRLPQAVFACVRCGTPMSKHHYPLTQAEVDPFHQGGMDVPAAGLGGVCPFPHDRGSWRLGGEAGELRHNWAICHGVCCPYHVILPPGDWRR
jgi:hypothetical protein